MRKVGYADAHRQKQYLGNWAFLILIGFKLFTLEICHLFLNSLLFNTFNSFNVIIESFQTIYQTDIV